MAKSNAIIYWNSISSVIYTNFKFKNSGVNTNQQFSMVVPPLQQFNSYISNTNSQQNNMSVPVQNSNNSGNMNSVYGYNQQTKVNIGSNNQNSSIQSSNYVVDENNFQQYLHSNQTNPNLTSVNSVSNVGSVGSVTSVNSVNSVSQDLNQKSMQNCTPVLCQVPSNFPPLSQSLFFIYI